MSRHERRLDHLLQLIDNVYEAAYAPERWSAIAVQVAEAFASTSTTLQIQHGNCPSTILSMTENVRARIQEYQGHFWQRDIWVERAVERIGLSRVGSSTDLVSDLEFQDTEFYRDWCRHLDVFYVVGAVFPAGAGNLGVLGVHRPRAAGAYDERDKRWVGRFLPHLQRALRVREELQRAAVSHELSLEALDRSQTAVVLTSADSSILFANRQAETLLKIGVGIRSRNGRLAATLEADNARLQALIGDACAALQNASSAEGVVQIRRCAQPSLGALVAPFRPAWPGQPNAGAVIFIRDPSTGRSIAGALRRLFGLTPTESRIAEALTEGKALPEIAAMTGAKVQTLRKQVKMILSKTGTRRQVECVAMILRGVAGLARD